jgi:hypothetical protein
MLQDRTGGTVEQLFDNLTTERAVRKRPEIASLVTTFGLGPVYIDVDQTAS